MTSLPYKVFDRDGVYLAATRRPEEAAVLVAVLGRGSEIRTGHRKADAVWREGFEPQSASESYDFVAQAILERRREKVAALHAQQDAIAAKYRADRPGPA